MIIIQQQIRSEETATSITVSYFIIMIEYDYIMMVTAFIISSFSMIFLI